MGTGRIYLKKIASWCIAGAVAFMVVNLGLFFYHRPAGWIDRANSATKSIWRPGSTVIHGTEGHGVYKVDENGYLNKGNLIEDGYTIVVGASFSQGEQVSLGERYTDILNTRLSLDQDSKDLVVYNVSQDGYFFPDIVHGFPALVQEFPNSKNLIIEIGSTDFSTDELMQAFDQCGFDESQTGSQIVSTLSAKKKLVMKVKESFPVLNMLKKQVKLFFSFGKQDEKSDAHHTMAQETKDSLHQALALIRTEYDGRLIICYHPNVEITNEGMKIKYQATTPDFASLCEKNKIEFVDVSEAFLDAYHKDFAVPYGFSNTTMGTGHLSREGHQVIADVLFDVLASPNPTLEAQQ